MHLESSVGDGEGGDAVSRRALTRRGVLPWLMSFGASRELGSLPVLLEVINCLEAALQVGFSLSKPLTSTEILLKSPEKGL